jgi:1-hydroxycarotenoid 3,4-desaturase
MLNGSEKVVIIGAGIGGLSAAALLAARGFGVTVVEKEAAVGGKLRTLSPVGRPIDAGPTVFTMRWVFESIFAQAGTDFAQSVKLTPLDILARHAWDNRETLDLHADVQASIDAIARFSGPDEGRRYGEFCAQAKRTYTTLEQPFLRGSKTSSFGLTQRIGFANLGAMMSIRPFTSLWNTLGRYFHDPRLRQLFGRYATYCGSSPYLAPATLMLIAHVEQSGVWSVEGGMHHVARAMAELAVRSGADIRCGSGCAVIEMQGGRVSAVRLDDGTTLKADHIIANCDPAAIATALFGAEASRAVTPTKSAERSLSAFCWVIDAATQGFDLKRHNVFFSPDYAAEFSDILGKGHPPADPTVYVCAQDRDQPGSGVTPGAPERIQIIVNAPANGDHRPFSPEEIALCQTRMLDRLAICGLTTNATPDQLKLTTPQGFNQLFPATGGALYGRATHGWAAAFKRPGARTAVPGLYLAGGGTHPGAGVPMAALSGWQAADSLSQDRASTRAFHPVATTGGTSTHSAKTGVTA